MDVVWSPRHHLVACCAMDENALPLLAFVGGEDGGKAPLQKDTLSRPAPRFRAFWSTSIRSWCVHVDVGYILLQSLTTYIDLVQNHSFWRTRGVPLNYLCKTALNLGSWEVAPCLSMSSTQVFHTASSSVDASVQATMVELLVCVAWIDHESQ